MKVIFFSMRSYEIPVFERANREGHAMTVLTERLTPQTAAAAANHDVVCCFANDQVNAQVLRTFKDLGIRLVALRSAGFNHVDMRAANELSLPVVRVPEYSPHAVAEHAVAMLLTLNRKIHRAYNRVHELNFSLEGLVGFDLYGKTAGVVGTGRIGSVFARIMHGFGCRVLAHDPKPDPAVSEYAEYTSLENLLSRSDIVSLHLPLVPETKHLLDAAAFGSMKSGAYLINTGRGALIDTRALIASLKQKHLGGACLDVYEEEENIFFRDLSERGLEDDVLARLLTFPNVLITSHQAFLTNEALTAIAEVTMGNISAFSKGDLRNAVTI